MIVQYFKGDLNFDAKGLGYEETELYIGNTVYVEDLADDGSIVTDKYMIESFEILAENEVAAIIRLICITYI